MGDDLKRRNFHSTTSEDGIATLERNNRLVKGQVFLWEGAKDWHDLWDEDGVIVATGQE